LLFEWTGDVRSIKRWQCQYRGMDIPTQDILCRGIVTKKYEANGEHLVELDIWTENPEGQKTTPGIALVALPTKG
jgi:hypothetical protein